MFHYVGRIIGVKGSINKDTLQVPWSLIWSRGCTNLNESEHAFVNDVIGEWVFYEKSQNEARSIQEIHDLNRKR